MHIKAKHKGQTVTPVDQGEHPRTALLTRTFWGRKKDNKDNESSLYQGVQKDVPRRQEKGAKRLYRVTKMPARLDKFLEIRWPYLPDQILIQYMRVHP